MKAFAIILLIAAASLVAAGDPAGFKYWSGAELKAYNQKLSPKINKSKSAGEQFGAFGNHNFAISHREGTADSEIHTKVNDVFIAESGEAKLVVGGTLVNEKTVAPNEIRGSGITGGVEKKLTEGDIVHIPAGMPHHLLVENGKHFTYFVIKINE